jgi:hypothetical protein
MNYEHKYLKYKQKYLQLKKQFGGNNKFYDFINYILLNDFTNFKYNNPNDYVIKSFTNNCISLFSIIYLALQNIKSHVKLEESEIKELDILDIAIQNKADNNFLLVLGATQSILDYLKNDPEKKIFKIEDSKDYIYRFTFDDIYNILNFSLQNTDVELNTLVGQIIWSHIKYLSNKYYYLINLYKKYKIIYNLPGFNEKGASNLCNLLNDNEKCINMNYLCEWNKEKCEKKIELESYNLFSNEDIDNGNESYSDDSDNYNDDSNNYNDDNSENNIDNYSVSSGDEPDIIIPSQKNYNIRLFTKLRVYSLIPFVEFFLQTDFLNFKKKSNRSKIYQSDIILILGVRSENLFSCIKDAVENFLKKIEESTQLSSIQKKYLNKNILTHFFFIYDYLKKKVLIDFFLDRGVNKEVLKYYKNDPDKKIFKTGPKKWSRFYNTEVFSILEYALQNGEINTQVGEIYWIYMQYLSEKYNYLIKLYKTYKIELDPSLTDISKLCDGIKEKVECVKNEYCQWNERGSIDKQCEKKNKKWNL